MEPCQSKTVAQEIADLRASNSFHADQESGLRKECLYLLQVIETAEQHIAYGRYDDAAKILYTAAHTHRRLTP